MNAESKHFKSWAQEEGICTTGDLKVFANVVDPFVGFDAEDFLTSLFLDPKYYEPLKSALGGLPFTFELHVDQFLTECKNANIIPTFIFPGGSPMSRDRQSIFAESRRASAVLNDAWEGYANGRAEQIVEEFGKAYTYRTDHFLRHLYFHLHAKGVKVFVAPYEPAAQLVQMLEDKTLKAVAGSASCLVFGASKVIVNFDWSNQRFSWITKEDALRKTMLSQDQFVDMCLLGGCSILPPFPGFERDTLASKMKAAKNVILQHRDGYNACQQIGDEHYTGLFRKAKFAAKHMVIIRDGGEVKQMNHETCPNDAHDFVGQRLPDELFTYTLRGLLGFRVLNWRTQDEILEIPPLDGGDNPAYRELVQKKLLPLRTRTLALLTHSLHRYWHKKDVELVCWFSEGEKKPLGLQEKLDVTKDPESWHVKLSFMEQTANVKGIDIKTSPLQYAIALLSDDTIAKKTVTTRKENEHSLLSRPQEILPNVLWRFLQDRGYINKDHTLSAWGKALKAAFERAKADAYLGTTTPISEAEEVIFIAFELLRLDALNGETLFPDPPYPETERRGTDVVKTNVNLISRIATLGSIQHDVIGWTGPLSRTLLAFQQMAAAVRNGLRDLVEIHASYLMTSGSAVRVRDYVEYTEIGSQLPFRYEPNVGLAVLVKTHLGEQLKQDKREDISKWFPSAVDVEEDLKKAWSMWDAVNAGVQAADSGIINSEVKDLFQTADSWLTDKRQLHRQVNGV